MGKYDAYLVCENGHGVNASYHGSPEFNKNFCTQCGAKTLHTCPNCKKDIEGDYHLEGVLDLISGPKPVPVICKYCGTPFPWKDKLESARVKSKPAERNDIALLETILDRFHLVAKQLRHRYDGREPLDIKDEYDVQDLLHALLRLYFDDIRTEEWNPNYAGASTRSDFLLKSEQIVIEVKKTRTNLKAKQLGEQLIIDIAKYKEHPDCKTLYCFVYDPDGYITNPRGIENDLNKSSDKSFKVKVTIVPKGH